MTIEVSQIEFDYFLELGKLTSVKGLYLIADKDEIDSLRRYSSKELDNLLVMKPHLIQKLRRDGIPGRFSRTSHEYIIGLRGDNQVIPQSFTDKDQAENFADIIRRLV
ncbi:MAG TPA: hypothetical protein PK639_00815 [Candidatus Woesebacteria bacterium]|nr:hypothetical protein [Candidatus Woesebacteria bacterium]